MAYYFDQTATNATQSITAYGYTFKVGDSLPYFTASQLTKYTNYNGNTIHTNAGVPETITAIAMAKDTVTGNTMFYELAADEGYITGVQSGVPAGIMVMTSNNYGCYIKAKDFTQLGSFTLTVNPNGGTFNSATTASTLSPNLIYGSSNWTSIGKATRTGYALTGYFTQASNGVKVYDSNGNYVPNTAYWSSSGTFIGTSNLTVYAQWAPYKVTLKYNVNSGVISDSPHSYIHIGSLKQSQFRISNNIIQSRSQTRNTTSDSWGAWSTWKDLEDEITTDKTHYNLWNLATFNLTRAGYYTNSDTTYMISSNSTNYKYFHTDDGNDNTVNVVTTKRLNNGTELTSDVTKTLTVNWIPKPQLRLAPNGGKITYEVNGTVTTFFEGSHIYDPANVGGLQIGTTAYNAIVPARRDNAIFKGYYTLRTGGSQCYKPDENDSTRAIAVPNSTLWDANGKCQVTSDITLYAQWQWTGTETIPTGIYNISDPTDTAQLTAGGTVGSIQSGAGVQVWTGHHQKFKIENMGSGKHKFTFQNGSGAANLVLDVKSGNIENDTRLQVYTSNNSDAQRWYLVNLGNGVYNILSALQPYPAIDRDDNGLTDAAVIHLWEYANNVNKRWCFRYQVAYNANSGSGTLTNSYHYINAAKALSTNTFTRTGYTFNSWNTTANGTGTSYSNSQSVTNIQDSNNYTRTLYAQWTANTTTITLHYGDTASQQTSITATYDSVMPSITIPTKTGYTFGGYFDGQNGSGIQYYSSTGTSLRNWNKDVSTSDLYARWDTNSNTVTLNLQGGTGETPNTVSASYGYPMPSIEDKLPTKQGYNFKGFYTQTNGEGIQYYKANGTSNRNWDKDENITLYAYWEKKTSELILYWNDGNMTTSVISSVQYDSPLPSLVELNIFPVKPGYKFIGYFDSNNIQYYKADGTSYQNWNKEDASYNLDAHWEQDVNCFIKQNNQFQLARMYVKVNGVFKTGRIYVKKNGQFVETRVV